jgi:N4-gp56 family major capsid protein
MATEVIADFSPADMTLYMKKGLDVLRADLHLSKWALPFTMERNSGKNVRAYRVGTLSAATSALTEATAPNVTPMTGTTFTATLAQYGAVNTFSDILEAVGPSSFMEQQSQIFGIQGAETLETLMYNELVSGASAFYANGSNAGSFDGTSMLTSKDFRRLSKQFRAKKVRGMLDDKLYRLYLHPDCAFDVTSDDVVGSVTDLQKRDADSNKWKDLIAVYGGVAAFYSQIVTTTTVQNQTAYENIACGYGAFAAYDLKGMPFRLMLVPPDDINVSNPLGLVGAVGWKVAFATDYIGSDGPRAYNVYAASSEPTA